MGTQVPVPPEFHGCAIPDLKQSTTGSVTAGDQDPISKNQRGGRVHVVTGFPCDPPQFCAGLGLQGDEGLGLENKDGALSFQRGDYRGRVAGFIRTVLPNQFAGGFVQRHGRAIFSPCVEQEQFAFHGGRSGKSPFWAAASEILLEVAVPDFFS